ncbi:hypothetical protein ACFWNR_06130 [Streptomyces virginiae]|uniref:hypothetical protein n=1 Tax=Streptomyces virginiae TaxID=1961 RepID=UPI0036562FE0
MNDIMPDPDFDTPDEFDWLMSQVPFVTPFQTLYDAAEAELLATWPQGFEVEKIGRLAFERLPEAEKAAALDELFYTYWSAREQDRAALARLAAGESRG